VTSRSGIHASDISLMSGSSTQSQDTGSTTTRRLLMEGLLGSFSTKWPRKSYCGKVYTDSTLANIHMARISLSYPGTWEAMLHLTTWDTLLLPDIILMDVLTFGMRHKGQDVNPIQACPRPIITNNEDKDEGACEHNQTHHNE
jgi:hypothetical protein